MLQSQIKIEVKYITDNCGLQKYIVQNMVKGWKKILIVVHEEN